MEGDHGVSQQQQEQQEARVATKIGRDRERSSRRMQWSLAVLIVVLVLDCASAGASSRARMDRITSSDLLRRQQLERAIQLAAFQQFGHRKTGKLYNVSSASNSTVLAIRLRVGSFGKHGVTINELSIPPDCSVNPSPQRFLLVYARLSNASLFGSLPQGRSLASPVVSLLAYDASNLSSTQQPAKLHIVATTTPISARLQPLSPGFSNLSCASFDDNSTAVNYSRLVQDDGACTTSQLGTFALVANASASPLFSPIISPRLERSSGSSNTWKIAVGSVIGGLTILPLLSLLSVGVAKQITSAKYARMEYEADHGEILQIASIRNSRAPAAGSTRTQPTLENDYVV